MKIHQIIRERRTAQGLTQEQVANYLGVSAPAVNKWERAVTYPDITLLPALARLLGTDLNTLLSFREELSEQEIGHFLKELTGAASEHGAEYAFQMGMAKIREFPSCDSLLLNVALALDGFFAMLRNEEKTSSHQNEIEELYKRAAKSKNSKVCNQAKVMLASISLNRREFQEAERWMEELPDDTGDEKRRLMASLLFQQNKWTEAAQLLEKKLLSELNAVQADLWLLLEIAEKENRASDARNLAAVAGQMTSLFELWDYNSYVPAFQLAVLQKDSDACLSVLQGMLSAALRPWKPGHSSLYRHLPVKESSENFGARMLPAILQDLENPNNHELDFLRPHPEFQNLLKEWKLRSGL